MNQETKKCQNCQTDFVIDTNDFAFYEKMNVPPPTWCPECRMIRRFTFRNDRFFYRRKEELSGKETFSNYPPASPVKTYEHDYWWSDSWDPMEYGQEFDPSRPFLEQFRELMYSVPWPAKNIMRVTNSDYCNNVGGAKNSYLCFDSDDLESSAYIVRGNTVQDGFDLYESRHSELVYDSYMVDEVYRIFFSVNCEDCVDIWFSRDMVGCQNCFGCTNLRGKSYYIFNKPYSKEDYKKELEQFNLGSYKTIMELKTKTHELWKKFPVRFTLAINTVNSTGEHIERTKNVKYGYSIHEAENAAYSQFIDPPTTDVYDYTVWGQAVSRMYEAVTCGEECYNVKFCWECWPNCRDMEYSVYCRSSENLFGCVGVQKKQYCILNKQYSKEDFEELRAKIIQQMNEMPYTDKMGRIYKYGEFFPSEFSPFAYNESIARDFFPLQKEEAESKGFLWREPDVREYETTIDASALPDDIKDVDDSIIKEVIKCGSCGRAYRIIQLELQFYRRIGLPMPRFCHNCRFNERFKFVNPPKWRPAKCQCAGAADDRNLYANTAGHFHEAVHCPNEFETSYPTSRPDIIYCEQCYKAEVY